MDRYRLGAGDSHGLLPMRLHVCSKTKEFKTGLLKL